jgi:hypothetical protein
VLFLLISNIFFLSAFEFDPPKPQPGDSETVPVTIGELRKALYYYDMALLLNDSVDSYKGVVTDLVDVIDKAGKEQLRLKKEKEKETKKKIFYRTSFLVTGSVLGVLIIDKIGNK